MSFRCLSFPTFVVPTFVVPTFVGVSRIFLLPPLLSLSSVAPVSLSSASLKRHRHLGPVRSFHRLPVMGRIHQYHTVASCIVMSNCHLALSCCVVMLQCHIMVNIDIVGCSILFTHRCVALFHRILSLQ